MWDPPAPQPSTNEWVEVVNRSSAAVDLTGLTVSDASSTSDAAPGPLVVEPGEFVVFVRNADAFAAAHAPRLTARQQDADDGLTGRGRHRRLLCHHRR
jgi:hypothetical protein